MSVSSPAISTSTLTSPSAASGNISITASLVSNPQITAALQIPSQNASRLIGGSAPYYSATFMFENTVSPSSSSSSSTQNSSFRISLVAFKSQLYGLEGASFLANPLAVKIYDSVDYSTFISFTVQTVNTRSARYLYVPSEEHWRIYCPIGIPLQRHYLCANGYNATLSCNGTEGYRYIKCPVLYTMPKCAISSSSNRLVGSLICTTVSYTIWTST